MSLPRHCRSAAGSFTSGRVGLNFDNLEDTVPRIGKVASVAGTDCWRNGLEAPTRLALSGLGEEFAEPYGIIRA